MNLLRQALARWRPVKRAWKIRQIDTDQIPALERAILAEKKNYVDFYEARQDFILRRDPAIFEKLNRIWQLEYLLKHGLQPGDRVLDYGCGPAAAGVFFIRYLDAGRWVGADISGESLRVGRALIARERLEDKEPELLHIPGGGLAALAGRTFDVILAQSVFTHLPPEEIVALLQRLPALLAPRGRLFASFSRTRQGIVRQKLHNWYYPLAFFEEAARTAALDLRVMDDWTHPNAHALPPFAASALALFTRPAAAA